MLLVYAPDRLARHYAYQVVVLDELRLAGCEEIFLNHPFGASPEEQMFLQIHGVFAEYERALIKERLRRGRLYAAREGRVNWGGNPPYGYRYLPRTETTPGQLVVEATEAEIVRQMFGWLVEETLTTYAITERLNTPGSVPTRGGQGAWRQSTVSDILRKEVYCADVLQPDDGRRRQAWSHGPRLQGSAAGEPTWSRQSAGQEWIPVQVPAIIDPETWELARVHWNSIANARAATTPSTSIYYGDWWCVGVAGGA